ncbi:PIG-L family deacetylase [Micromonosporaceae bacterium Da 78-11]
MGGRQLPGRVRRAAAGLLAVAVVAAAVVAASSAVAVPSPAVAADVPCVHTLNVVAHEDDDLLFLNPAVSDDIAAGRCVTTIFVTAGDAGRGAGYWRARELGAMAAYARMANSAGSWSMDTLMLAGHAVTRRTMVGSRVRLLFLRLPDAVHRDVNLPRLFSGEIPAVLPLDSAVPYTRAGLIAVLSAVLDAEQPQDVRTLDFVGGYSDGDHVDHHTVGHFTEAAQRTYRAPHRLSGYLGYPVADRPANLTDDVRDEKLAYFLAYAPYDRRVCQSGVECLTNFYAPRFSHSVVTGTGIGIGRTLAVRTAGQRPRRRG